MLRLEFTVPSAGKHELKLFLMSDSYVGVDQEPSFSVTAAEGMDLDEDEDEDGGRRVAEFGAGFRYNGVYEQYWRLWVGRIYRHVSQAYHSQKGLGA